MWRRVTGGLIAGAVGTLALNVATYVDMVVRARPASPVPARAVAALAAHAGVGLGGQSSARHRQEALGALLGYGIGVGFGMAYGLLRPWTRRVAVVPAGVLLSGVTMLTELPAGGLGGARPRTWSAGDWLTGVGPHLAYGLTVAAVFSAIDER